MDIDMEIDDIFLEDPIESFLKRKLEAINEANKHSKTSIESFIVDLERNNSLPESPIEVGPLWKRISDGKVVIGFTAYNYKEITYENLDLSYLWTPNINPTYKMKIFRVDTNTYYILTVINKSCFVKCKEYNGNLRLFYTEEEKTYANKLAVTIRTEDFACSDLEVKNIDVINGVPEAVFTKIACSCEIKLAAVLSIGILRDYLIIDCMFREVNLRGQKEPTYFLDGVSQHLNECLLKYRDSQEGFSELTIYFRNKGHLYQILHFLLRNIKDLIVVPLKCKSLLRLGKFQDDVHMYESQRTNSEEVHAFGDALLRHFDCVIDFHKAVLDNKDVPQDADVSDLYLSFRRSLTKHEYNTDFLYRKLLQNS